MHVTFEDQQPAVCSRINSSVSCVVDVQSLPKGVQGARMAVHFLSRFNYAIHMPCPDELLCAVVYLRNRALAMLVCVHSSNVCA